MAENSSVTISHGQPQVRAERKSPPRPLPSERQHTRGHRPGPGVQGLSTEGSAFPGTPQGPGSKGQAEPCLHHGDGDSNLTPRTRQSGRESELEAEAIGPVESEFGFVPGTVGAHRTGCRTSPPRPVWPFLLHNKEKRVHPPLKVTLLGLGTGTSITSILCRGAAELPA